MFGRFSNLGKLVAQQAKAAALSKGVEALMMAIPPNKLKRVADAILDVIEDEVKESANVIDDAFVLPMCKRIRETFDIPDND